MPRNRSYSSSLLPALRPLAASIAVLLALAQATPGPALAAGTVPPAGAAAQDAPAPDSASAAYQAGLAHLENREYPAAAAAFQRAIELDPRQIDARLRLGGVYELQGRLEEALDAYRGVVQWAEPKSAEAAEAIKKLRYVTATQHAKSGEIDQALPLFEELYRDYPDDVLIAYSTGVAYMLKNRMDEARAAFEKVLELDPKYINAYLNLATVHEAQGDVGASVDALREAAEIDPNSEAGRKARVRLQLIEAQLLARDGNLQDALSAFQRALELDPGNRIALYSSAQIYDRLGDGTGALRAYEDIVKAFPEDTVSRLRLAELYLSGEHYLQAYDQLQEIIARGERSPQEARARDLLARLRATEEGKRIEQDKILARIAELREEVKTRPDDIEAQRTLAVLYVQQGMYRDARAPLEAVQRLAPEDMKNRAILAAVYDQLGLFAESVEEYAWLLARPQSEDTAALITAALRLANAKRLFVDGQLEAAGREFTEIVAEDPSNAVADFYLGLIYSSEDEVDRAVDAYKEVIRLMPTHAGARLNLAFSYERLNREEEAIDEYRKILQANPPPEVAATARSRLEQVQRRIHGLTTSVGYQMAYDSNTNLSDQQAAGDYRSDLTLDLTYQYKMENGIRWRLAVAPSYSNYHKGQFDYFNTNATVSAAVTPSGYTLVGGYSHRTSDGLLTDNRLSRAETLFAESLSRLRLPRLTGFDLKNRVVSDVTLNLSYSEFVAKASPFFSSYTPAAGISVGQPLNDLWTLHAGYNFVINENKELVGSDYAYRSHGFTLSADRRMPWGQLNMSYGFTYFNYTNPDSFSHFTQRRVNTRHNLALGATYRFRPDIDIFSTLSWTANNSNLPVGFVLNTEDVIEGQQSSSLSDYTRWNWGVGMNLRF